MKMHTVRLDHKFGYTLYWFIKSEGCAVHGVKCM